MEKIENAEENREKLKNYKKMEGHYQKVGIVKYDAFHEMGGDLSFALTMLDENNTGWILNAMHSREGCYTYIKEVIKGESYIELSGCRGQKPPTLMPTDCSVLRTPTILPNIRISWDYHPTFMLISGRVLRSFTHL